MIKYRLTNETTEHFGHKLYRIKAVKEIKNETMTILPGELGGFIEKEENLSQDGNCWIFSNTYVFDNARVKGNSYVKDSRIYGDAVIADNAIVIKSNVDCSSCICENAVVFDSTVSGQAYIGQSATVKDSFVGEFVQILDNAEVIHSSVKGNCIIVRDAKIKQSTDVFCVSQIGDNQDRLTFYKTDKGVSVNINGGVFHTYTLNEFVERFSGGVNPTAIFYMAAAEMARKIFSL